MNRLQSLIYEKTFVITEAMYINLSLIQSLNLFVNTVLLYNDVPMEIVSKLLGHSSMKITQDSYGKIVEKKISLEMERLKGNC